MADLLSDPPPEVRAALARAIERRLLGAASKTETPAAGPAKADRPRGRARRQETLKKLLNTIASFQCRGEWGLKKSDLVKASGTKRSSVTKFFKEERTLAKAWEAYQLEGIRPR